MKYDGAIPARLVADFDCPANELDFSRVPADQIAAIVGWLQAHLEPSTRPYKLNSYQLKHLADRDGCGYTTNGQFAALLQLAGFELVPTPAYPWCEYRFRGQLKSESKLRFRKLQHGIRPD